ncbi:hypothetical protein MLD38_012328 [Melastoma candidum]|uniref:Uncharacterized protein n=1 Tax=Melastoma candidum TaxID=119954 RepID=A0ACB9R7R8_9MYRT|nr:hypothetical protein MLD38_012328 [Melastoma candidum]
MSLPQATSASGATGFPTKPKLKATSKATTQTPESKHLSSFKTRAITPNPFPSSIPCISFSPSSPHPFAAAHSASFSLFQSLTLTPSHTVPLSDVVSSLSFRLDGALLAASDLTGTIRVIDVKSRTPLRRLASHSRPVRFVKYPAVADKLHLVSGGDDGLVKYWDVAGESVVREFRGHKDYVRSGDCSPVDAECFVTGSYDHVVRLWDVRSGGRDSVMEVNHGKPVEDVVYLPSGSLIATAGGNTVKVWDLISGGRMVCEMESHNKTVTSLCVGRVGKPGRGDAGEEGMEYRILSVGLDGYLKVFDYSRLKVTYSLRLPAALLSVGVSADGQVLAIGTSNGNIFAGKRKTKDPEGSDTTGSGEVGIFDFGELPQARPKVLRPGSYRYFHRGQSEKPAEEEHVIAKPKKVKLAEHDKLLKKFRHKEALVSAIRAGDPEKVVAVMEELIARKKLLKCVSNVDEEEELEVLLKFLHKNTTVPRHAGLLMGLARKVVDAKAEEISTSEALKVQVRNLKRAVEEEVRIQEELLEIQGMISPLLRIAGRR